MHSADRVLDVLAAEVPQGEGSGACCSILQ